MKGVDFLQYFKRIVDWQKTPPNLEINHGRTVWSFVYIYTHSMREAEMIKCFATIVDIVAS